MILNWNILKHPVNWLVVAFWLVFWLMVFDLLHAWVNGRNPAMPAYSTDNNPGFPSFRSAFSLQTAA